MGKCGILAQAYIFNGNGNTLIEKVFLDILIQQKNIFINSIAASLQNRRPNIFRCQYVG